LAGIKRFGVKTKFVTGIVEDAKEGIFVGTVAGTIAGTVAGTIAGIFVGTVAGTIAGTVEGIFAPVPIVPFVFSLTEVVGTFVRGVKSVLAGANGRVPAFVLILDPVLISVFVFVLISVCEFIPSPIKLIEGIFVVDRFDTPPSFV